MKQISLKNDMVLAEANSKCLLIKANAGWTVPISPERAIEYVMNYDRDDNSKNKENYGFFDMPKGVVLTHNDAKITFSNQEVSALIELINTAEQELWLQETQIKAYRTTKTCPAIIKLGIDTLHEARTKEDVCDYSQFSDIEAAWDAEREEDWVKEGITESDSVEDLKQEFLDGIVSYTPEDALKEARRGHQWPLILGYVERYKSSLSKRQKQIFY